MTLVCFGHALAEASAAKYFIQHTPNLRKHREVLPCNAPTSASWICTAMDLDWAGSTVNVKQVTPTFDASNWAHACHTYCEELYLSWFAGKQEQLWQSHADSLRLCKDYLPKSSTSDAKRIARARSIWRKSLQSFIVTEDVPSIWLVMAGAMPRRLGNPWCGPECTRAATAPEDPPSHYCTRFVQQEVGFALRRAKQACSRKREAPILTQVIPLASASNVLYVQLSLTGALRIACKDTFHVCFVSESARSAVCVFILSPSYELALSQECAKRRTTKNRYAEWKADLRRSCQEPCGLSFSCAPESMMLRLLSKEPGMLARTGSSPKVTHQLFKTRHCVRAKDLPVAGHPSSRRTFRLP